MDWSFSNDRAIYTQIVEKIQQCIVSGKLNPGEKIPAVRELAAEAGVNPNTMQRALAHLEQIGFLYSTRTSGRYVTENTALIQSEKNNVAMAEMEKFFEKMKNLGFSKDEIVGFIKNYETEVTTNE